MKKIDFTDCGKIFGRAYNGANGKKIAVEYNGRVYMLKFPPSAEGKQTELSYTSSCISEHIASSVFGLLEIPAQKTMLGTFRVAGKEKVVGACLDFTDGGKVLYDFCSIKNTVIDSEHGGTGTELSDLIETFEKQEFVNPKELEIYFWDMFVVDALLGNFDRHNGNWGFLVDHSLQTAEIAPVFDCGSCLLPQADDKVMDKVLKNEDELNARIFQFPASAIREHGRKICYYDFLMAGEYPECNKALLRIVPRINIKEIQDFIDTVPYLSELQNRFYKTYIRARLERLLLPAYKKVEGTAF